jgi:hypothetical protein
MIKLALVSGFISLLGLAAYATVSAYRVLSDKTKQYIQTTKTINRKPWNP